MPDENATACAAPNAIGDRLLEALDERALGDERLAQRCRDRRYVLLGDLLPTVGQEGLGAHITALTSDSHLRATRRRSASASFVSEA